MSDSWKAYCVHEWSLEGLRYVVPFMYGIKILCGCTLMYNKLYIFATE